MRSRIKVKVLNIRYIRSKSVNKPYQILAADILTGHVGEPMLHELYQLQRLKNRKWRD